MGPLMGSMHYQHTHSLAGAYQLVRQSHAVHPQEEKPCTHLGYKGAPNAADQWHAYSISNMEHNSYIPSCAADSRGLLHSSVDIATANFTGPVLLRTTNAVRCSC